MEHTIEQRFEALRVSTPFCEDYTNSPAKAITRRNIIKKHLDNVFGAYGSVESRERLRLKFDLYFDIEACTDGMKLPDKADVPDSTSKEEPDWFSLLTGPGYLEFRSAYIGSSTVVSDRLSLISYYTGSKLSQHELEILRQVLDQYFSPLKF